MARFFLCICMPLMAIGILSCSAAADGDGGVQFPPVMLKYHNGLLLKGKQCLNLVWYGGFSDEQKSVISYFVGNLSVPAKVDEGGEVGAVSPTVSSWWSTTGAYLGSPSVIQLGEQTNDITYSFGRNLTFNIIARIARRAASGASMVAVLTSNDVNVDGFCPQCSYHRWWKGAIGDTGTDSGLPFIWVGNAASRCPGVCGWPFYKTQNKAGLQMPPLIAPKGDPAMYAMVIHLAAALAGAVTNPDGRGGFFQGTPRALKEAVTACTGIFGSGAFLGYPGLLLVDNKTGASYNAVTPAGSQYLLPAMWDPKTSKCKTFN